MLPTTTRRHRRGIPVVLALAAALTCTSEVRGQFPSPVRPEPAASRVASADRATRGAADVPRPATVADGPKALRGPVDESQYIVGPGDGFGITIWVQPAVTIEASVSPEGSLVLPGVALVSVAGRTLADTKAALAAAIARQYRNVQVDVALVALRRIEVNVVGNVLRPGTYVGTALDAASRMIELAGGAAAGAGRRNIEIRRRNGDTARLDLVRYERTGALDANPPILDGDVLVVPWEKSRVVVEGAVEVPGTYELCEGDTIGTMLEIAGGLRMDARPDSIELRRFTDSRRTDRMVLSLQAPGSLGTGLRDGDQIYVRAHHDWRVVEAVVLEGEFRFPGPYGINEGEDRLADVIERAGGFTDLASLGEAQLLRTRGVDPIDVEYERLKQIPVQDMSEKEYAYFKSKSRERKGLVVVDFERLATGDDEENQLLSAGDRIIVPRRRATITVSGSVTFPGLITFEPGKRASYYVEQAGGYSSNADRGGARVVRGVTGEWEPLSRVQSIAPGDEIWVPERADRNWWQLARETVSFVASVATVYLVIDQASR